MLRTPPYSTFLVKNATRRKYCPALVKSKNAQVRLAKFLESGLCTRFLLEKGVVYRAVGDRLIQYLGIVPGDSICIGWKTNPALGRFSTWGQYLMTVLDDSNKSRRSKG
jgi:hypothetical protein